VRWKSRYQRETGKKVNTWKHQNKQSSRRTIKAQVNPKQQLAVSPWENKTSTVPLQRCNLQTEKIWHDKDAALEVASVIDGPIAAIFDSGASVRQEAVPY